MFHVKQRIGLLFTMVKRTISLDRDKCIVSRISQRREHALWHSKFFFISM